MPDQNPGSGAQGSEGATITDVALSGVSKEEIKILQELAAKTKSSNEEKELVRLRKENEILKNSVGEKDLSDKISKLSEENEQLQSARKADLLNQLTKKEQEKYKDKSMQDLELILEVVKDRPKRKGIQRGSDSDKDEQQELRKELADGEVGSYDFKTKKWK